ncbi:MAG: hypothetical protein BMS9Abin07_1456 [Acidimicrobiia bacterium]|nr:MAG: hypothetical protein BMS9Abin07_1456 [Acidimicrobiia bacterium]
MQAHAAQGRRWPFWFLIASFVALVIGFLPAALGYPTVYTADPQLYAEAMDRLFGGQIPYLDFGFEHLPLAIAPMALAHIIASITGVSFAYPFMLIMLGMVFVIGVLVVRIGEDLGLGDVGLRWMVMVAPMLVIIPHRVDALSVMLAVAAIFFAVRRMEVASFGSAIGAVLSKGWPVVLAAADWWRGKRRHAFGLVGITVAVGVLLLLLPGFRAGRSFVGVHEETLSGTIVIVWRLLLGTNPGIVDSAGAVYVETGAWALALNLVVGAAIAVAALTVLRRSFSWQGGVAVTGALTYAVLLASPLLSTQFLLWPIPFVALTGSRQGRWLLTAAAAISVALTGIWFPGRLWWHTGWLIRNVVLVAAAIYTVADAHRVAGDYEASTSRRNLPV